MSYDVTLRFRRAFSGVPKAVDTIGEQALFYGETIRYIPNALTRYRKETIRNIAEMTMGTGALVMIGGTVGVAAFGSVSRPKPPPSKRGQDLIDGLAAVRATQYGQAGADQDHSAGCARLRRSRAWPAQTSRGRRRSVCR